MRLSDRVIGVNHRVIGLNHHVIGVNHRVIGLNHCVIGVNHRVIGLNHRVIGVNHHVIGANHRVIGANHHVIGLNHRVIGVNHHVMEPNHRARSHSRCTGPFTTCAGIRRPYRLHPSAIARDLLAKEILIAVERVDEVVADKRVDAHGEFSREDPERQDLVAWHVAGEW
jgi:hypothetical protein